MEFKPFPIHVGYDTRITEYEQGKRGKIPKSEVMSWLHENVSGWQFNWTDPEEGEPNRFIEIMEYIEEVNKHYKRSGGTFYFDSEEDRLLFCLKWIANGVEDPLMWHPV
jgi:hypothetical protein